MIELLNTVALPALTLLIWSALASWVFIKSRAEYRTRWLLMPASLAAAACYGFFVAILLGYAVAAPLPDKFEFLGYNVVIEGNKKVAIEVWAGAGRTRLYRIPYTKEAEKTMKEAQKLRQAGGVMRMERKGPKSEKGEGEPGGTEQFPYQSNLLMPPDINPKTP